MRISGILIGALAMGCASLASAQQATPVASASQDEIAARVAVVQRHVDAYRSGNLDRFMATFSPGAEVHALGMSAFGRGDIRELYRLNFAPGAPTIRIHGSEVAGEFVFLTIGYVSASGEELFCSFTEYGVTGEKVSYVASSVASCPGD